MGGPWFTVQRSGGPWKTLDRIWISNGNQSDRARVEYRVRLEEPNDANE